MTRFESVLCGRRRRGPPATGRHPRDGAPNSRTGAPARSQGCQEWPSVSCLIVSLHTPGTGGSSLGGREPGDDRPRYQRRVGAVQDEAPFGLDLEVRGEANGLAAVRPGPGVDEEGVTQVDVAGLAGGVAG